MNIRIVSTPSRYNAFYASRAGSKHDGKEENNQDFGGVHVTDNHLFMAVCDGLGSCKHSRQGAEIVVDLAVKFLEYHDWKKPFEAQARTFIAKTQKELETVAAKNGFSTQEMACTLLAFAVRGDMYRAMQLGDGFIVARFASNAKFEMLFPSMEKEYASDVIPVTAADAITSLLTREGSSMPHFVCLSSDGVERQAITQIYTSNEHPFAKFFEFLIDEVLPGGQEHLHQYLSLPFWNECTTDDRTLACALLSQPKGNQ